mmetsp:Transcript_12818/g.19294  ORF Transcript_12818/g.19294 Transcript_12818/m.19294 type:complete len:477 (-) Transcript_12818:154-1584(-)|eukprot:CAMPEP_0185030938 /NCGR_PEP_ID=MMETSP1103-20130426/18101_1 /TAXON_ID=36769 /ORGANISM="Paraphysomonas bandaiensis, Strain Caron Lab Isolate" /LENGTH=476 /DNA_ID=CAMNT_0027566253 /DNA_START=116 /DNA_END=1546 /DNA_ORIENTATION=+
MKRKSSKHHHHHQYLTDVGPGGRHKYATRHLAALDFLQSISMKNEHRIMESCYEVKFLSSGTHSGVQGGSEGKIDSQHPNVTLPREEGPSIAGGRKLDGRYAPVASVPRHMRYRMNRFNEQSALVKQWEDALLHTQMPSSTHTSQLPNIGNTGGLLGSRLFFSRSHGYPLSMLSVIPYTPEAEKARAEKQAESSQGAKTYKLPQRDWRGISFRGYFQDTGNSTEGDLSSPSQQQSLPVPRVEAPSGNYLHDPYTLDDPDMMQGKHRYVLRGDASTGPVMSSVILFVNAKDLKDDLNEKFRERHPTLPQTLSLSKIRNLKKAALLGSLALDLEVSTVAIAFICFEQLCLKGLVTKANRRLSMAVCLILAVKFNESISDTCLDSVFEFADRQWSIPKKEILEAEFGAFMHLNFSLHVPHEHVFVVYSRLLKQMHKTSRVYLGDDVHGEYTQSLLDLDASRRDALRKAAAQLSQDEKSV